MPEESPQKKGDTSWLWVVALIVGGFLWKQCTGVNPASVVSNTWGSDGAEYYSEMAEERDLLATIESSPCSQFLGHGDSYLECLRHVTVEAQANNSSISRSANISGCPSGCNYHKTGCNIKGNISFESKEKIYHLPGMEFYDDTVINTDYGERWFCTEAEAIANGWRKAEH